MMKHTIFTAFLALAALAATAAETIYFNDCENTKGNSVVGISRSCGVSRKNAFSGTCCAYMLNQGVVNGAGGSAFLPAEPSQWYRLTVMSRNDMPTGVIRIGFTTSSDAEGKQVIWHGRYHKVLPCNSHEWRPYTLELKTTPETRGINFILRVDGSPEKQGTAYFDDIRIEKIDAPVVPLTLAPYEALVTFTDQPTMLAYRPDATKLTNVWRTLDLKSTAATVKYDALAAGSSIVCRVHRADKDVFTETKNASGTGSCQFHIPVETLPEGHYELELSAISDGKVLSAIHRTLRRIPASAIQPPPMEPIKTAGQLPGTKVFGINGKYYPFILACAFPNRVIPTRTSMPGFEEYMTIARRQTGFNVCGASYVDRRPQWPRNPMGCKSLQEVADFYVKSFREQMDIAQKLGYYSTASLHEGPGSKTYDELNVLIARGIKSHPNFVAYTYDEPECRKESPARMDEQYKVLKAEDPDHIIDVNLCQPWHFKEYANSSDTASLDYYPFHGTDLLEWESFCKQMLAGIPGKPFISYLQLFNFEGEPLPTSDELTAQMRLGIILGQRVLPLYAWSDPVKCESCVTNMEMQSLLKGLVAEFYTLMDAIVPANEVTLPAKTDSGIRYAAYQKGNETCLVIVNISPLQNASFTLDNATGTAENFFDAAWKVNLKKTLTLRPCESMVLRLAAK